MMETADNPLGALFLEATSEYGDRIAIAGPDTHISYLDLQDLTAKLAVRFQSRGVGRDSVVGFNLGVDESLPTLLSILALTLLGAQWMQYALYPRGLPIKLTHLLNEGGMGPPELCTISLPELLDSLPTDNLAIAVSDFFGYASAHTTWAFTASSGTTGVPKCMAISGENFSEAILRMDELPRGRGSPKVVSLFPASTWGGSLHFLRTLYVGGTFLLSKRYDFLAAQKADYFMASPAHFAALLANAPTPESPVFGEVRLVGAALTPEFLARIRNYVRRVRVGYGATEVGPICTRIVEEDVFRKSVGYCCPGAVVEIVDDQGSSLPAGSEGTVRVRTSSHIEGYLEDAKATREAFRGGWFLPGDRGYLCAEGELYITGRVQDHLNAGGVKINAANLDEIMRSASGVADALCFLVERDDGAEELAAMVVIEEGSDMDAVLGNVVAAMAEHKLHRTAVPRRLYCVNTIPRNDNGKAMRHKATEMAGQLSPAARIGKN